MHFNHVGKGLISKDGQPLTWFETAGKDGKFFPAKADISGDAIVITSPQVSEPWLVRFAWHEAARPNFYNRNGLPAVPFRTDIPFTQASSSKTAKNQPDHAHAGLGFALRNASW